MRIHEVHTRGVRREQTFAIILFRSLALAVLARSSFQSVANRRYCLNNDASVKRTYGGASPRTELERR